MTVKHLAYGLAIIIVSNLNASGNSSSIKAKLKQFLHIDSD